MTLVEVKDLKKYFPLRGGMFRRPTKFVHAVDGVSFSINRGETFGLVGESGCGKTTLGKCMLRLIEPTSGEIIFDGINILALKKNGIRRLRRDMQTIFQDPQSSLDPRMMIRDMLMEPLKIHDIAKGSDREKIVLELLLKVGLNPDHLYRFSHEFSGGQRQRITIARILTLNPRFIVLDEPTSSLDVSVQAQILNLLRDLQKELGLSYLFISHDFSVIEYTSDTIAVMYLGKIVEIAPRQELFKEQIHPYTKALFSVIPIPDPHVKRDKILLSGEPPSPVDLPKGCRFFSRCQIAKAKCARTDPDLVDLGKNHLVACHLK